MSSSNDDTNMNSADTSTSTSHTTINKAGNVTTITTTIMTTATDNISSVETTIEISPDHDDYVIDYGTLLKTIRFSKKHIEKCTGRPDLDIPNLPEDNILCLYQYPGLWNRYALEVVPHMKYIQAQHQLWQVRQELLEARQEAQ